MEPVLDIHPEREQPEFRVICPECMLCLVLARFVTERENSGPEVRVFALNEGYTWEEIDRERLGSRETPSCAFRAFH
jgi:hypothetical protein